MGEGLSAAAKFEKKLESRGKEASTHPMRCFTLCGMLLWVDHRASKSLKLPENMNTIHRHLLSHDHSDEVPGQVPTFFAGPDAKLSRADGTIAGAVVEIDSPAAQNDALALVGCVEWAVIQFPDDTVNNEENVFIPVENLIAATANTGTRLAVKVRTVEEVQGVALALQTGVDALILADDVAPEVVMAAQAAVADRDTRAAGHTTPPLPAEEEAAEDLRPCPVRSVSPAGMGDRVAIDFTVLLSHDEGCLLGSSAKALALVHGETEASGFVPARPFRVNAGPVHQYVMMGDGGTKYLAEVKAGDQVALFSSETGRPSPRKAGTVGRCKIEPRPMLMVEFATDGQTEDGPAATLFLQQAETVRLATLSSSRDAAGAKGEASLDLRHGRTPVTSIKPGNILRVALSSSGTHIGKRIRSSVTER